MQTVNYFALDLSSIFPCACAYNEDLQDPIIGLLRIYM